MCAIEMEVNEDMRNKMLGYLMASLDYFLGCCKKLLILRIPYYNPKHMPFWDFIRNNTLL